MATRNYRISPLGIFLYPWFNAPDTKFNADGLFKTDHLVDATPGEKLKAELELDLKAAFEEFTKDMKPAEKKAWKMELPVKEDLDDAGNETGKLVFKYRQNAKIKLKDGTVKEVTLGIRDAADKPMHKKVWGGSEGRVMFSVRPIKIASSKTISLRLDFAKVQVTKLSEGQAGGGFGAVEGGYVEEEDAAEDQDFGRSEAGSAPAGGDY